MFKKSNCQEIHLVFDYVEDRLAHRETSQPTVQNPYHQRLLDMFEKMLDSEQMSSDLLMEILKESSQLSEFDINITHISNDLYEASDELAEANSSNMAIVEETTAGVNEISSTISSSVDIIEGINERSNELMTMNSKNRNSIQEIIRIKDLVSDNSNAMSDKIRILQNTSNKVDEIVEGVRAIAEQTNLLALNASIEAARAGEQGRGFAVVAEEIRKLAEGTKLKLEDMQNFTSTIRSASDEGIVSMEATLDSIVQMDENIEKINDTFQISFENTEHTVKNIQDLSSMIRSLDNSSREISTAIHTVAEESERISERSLLMASDAKEAQKYSSRISQIDENLSSIIKELLAIFNKRSHPMSNQSLIFTLENAISSHKKWVEKLGKMVHEQTIQPIQKDGKKCTFGHFYAAFDIDHPLISKEWKSIDEIHMKLHHYAHDVTNAIEKNDYSNAQSAFQQAESLSHIIIEKIQTIIKKIHELDAAKETVFPSMNI